LTVVKHIEGRAEGKDASVGELIIRDIPAGRHDSVIPNICALGLLTRQFEKVEPAFEPCPNSQPAPSRYSLQTEVVIVRASYRGWRDGFDQTDAMTQMTQMTQGRRCCARRTAAGGMASIAMTQMTQGC